MDYSKYTFNELTEALTAMDKKAYPDNYKALSFAIQNYPASKLRTEAFIDEVSPMGISQLKRQLAVTDDKEHQAILNELITFKSNRLKRAMIWLKWLCLIVVTIIITVLLPKDLKSYGAIAIGISALISIVMAIRQHKIFNRNISAD